VRGARGMGRVRLERGRRSVGCAHGTAWRVRCAQCDVLGVWACGEGRIRSWACGPWCAPCGRVGSKTVAWGDSSRDALGGVW